MWPDFLRELLDGEIIRDRGAMQSGIEDIFEGDASIIRPRIVVERRASEILGRQSRLAREGSLRI